MSDTKQILFLRAEIPLTAEEFGRPDLTPDQAEAVREVRHVLAKQDITLVTEWVAQAEMPDAPKAKRGRKPKSADATTEAPAA
tara:strand:- start:400 stop:648 length:249 start_codon:yes stop_codon:yes gene_type:complete